METISERYHKNINNLKTKRGGGSNHEYLWSSFVIVQCVVHSRINYRQGAMTYDWVSLCICRHTNAKQILMSNELVPTIPELNLKACIPPGPDLRLCRPSMGNKHILSNLIVSYLYKNAIFHINRNTITTTTAPPKLGNVGCLCARENDLSFNYK